jgi:hypothetical protein
MSSYPFSIQRNPNQKFGEIPSLKDFGAKGDVQVFEGGNLLSVTASSTTVTSNFTACTGTITSSGSTVTGTGTAFLSQCVVGNYITSGGQTLQIISIASNTSLTTGVTSSLDSFGAPVFTATPFSPHVSSASFTCGVGFTSLTDVGKRIVIYGAGGSGGQVQWIASASAGQGSTNSFATATILDAQGATFIGVAGNCALNGVTWEVYGNSTPTMSGATSVSGPTAIIPLATSISYTTSSPAFRYYLVQIKSTTSGQPGTAYISSMARGYVFGASISSVTSPTQAVVSTVALTTRSECYSYFGTDDTGAIQQAMDVGTALGTPSSADGGIIIYAPRGKYLFSSPIFHKHCVVLQGNHGGGTIFYADGASMPNNVSLWNMTGTFTTDGEIAFFTRLEDVRIDCGYVPGSIGIFCDALQENSGLYRTTIIKWRQTGIQVCSVTDQFGCANWIIQDPWIYPGDDAFLDNTVRGIIGDFAASTTIIRATVLAQGGFICGYGTAIDFSNGALHCIGQIHIESANIGIHFNSGSNGFLEEVDTQFFVFIATQIDAGNSVVLNNINSSGQTSIIDNTQTNTITQGIVSRYVCNPITDVEILATALQLNQNFPAGGPNIITFDPINLGTDKQGGFICINTRNAGFPNWKQTSSSLTYLLGMWLRLGASRFEVLIGTATNTNGTNPGTSYLVVDNLLGGVQTPRLYFDNTSNLGALLFGNNLGTGQIRWQHGLSGQGTLVLQWSNNSGSTWSDVFLINIPTGNIFFPNGANFASGSPFGSGLYWSNGTPNGSISAQPGSVCFDLGGNLWVKTTGSGNTGWSTLITAGGINQLTGDVAAGPGTGSQVATIQPGVVTLAKMANLSANSIIGNNTGSSTIPIALTQAQVTALLNVFSSSLKGLVPASGGGTANFLRADASFQPVVASLDGMTGSITITISNSGTGGPQLSCIASGGVEAFTLTQPGAWTPYTPTVTGMDAGFSLDCAYEITGKTCRIRISCDGTPTTGGVPPTFTTPLGVTAKSVNQCLSAISFTASGASTNTSEFATFTSTGIISLELGIVSVSYVQRFTICGPFEMA